MQAARHKVPPTLDARPVAGRLDLPLQGGGESTQLFPPPPGVLGDTPNPDEEEG